MHNTTHGTPKSPRSWRRIPILFLSLFFVLGVGFNTEAWSTARARDIGNDHSPARPGTNPADPLVDEQIEQSWKPDYLNLATGDPNLSNHGVYNWPFDLNSIGWSMQSYQDYGGTPYFHHGMDMMKMWGTEVYNRSGGQVINIENYQPGWDLYWEVAVLDPDGYIWQYHHVNMLTIPQLIWDKWNEYKVDPSGGYIPPDTYLGDIIEWPVWSFYDYFNHIHLNILAAGGVYVNGFEFHVPLPDEVGPDIQGVGLVQNGQVYPGNSIEGNYSLYVHARDLILDQFYYLPPWEITFSVDGGPVHTTWRFDTLPGGASDTAYLDDFYLVPPTCGDYECRDYYIDLGFIPDSQFEFPATSGQHTVLVSVSDYAGNEISQPYTYTVIDHPPIANPQSVPTLEDTPLDIILTGSDPDGDPLTFSVVTSPTHGILSGEAPNLIYSPAANFNGTDSLSFVANDGLMNSEPANVIIDVQAVNDAPVADPQSAITRQSTSILITLSGSDIDNEALTYSIIIPPEHGALSGTAPNLIYTPAPGYAGLDNFSFVANDGELDSAPATVSIDIQYVIFMSVLFR